jgi:hypothetical protein
VGEPDQKMNSAASRFRIVAVAACLTSCFPSFDGLTGGGDGAAGGSGALDAALEARPTEAGPPAEAGPDDGSGDAVEESCVIDQDAMTSKNCGRCGRDCELGECVSGDCTPYQFVSDQQPVQLALDGAYLYWTDGGDSGSVYRISRSGVGGAKLLVSGQKNPSGIAVTTDKIYWLEQGTADQSGRILGSDGFIRSAALDGTGMRPLGSSFKRPLSLVIDSGRAYVSEHGINDISKPSDGDVVSCAIPDCADRHFHGGIAIYPMQILLRADSLYWTSETSDSDNQFGSIWQILTTATTATRMFPATKLQAYRMAFSPDGSVIYYTSKNFQSITRHPLGAGEVTLLHFNFEPHALLVDDRDLFAINANDYTVPQGNVGSLLRVGKDDLTMDGMAPASLKRFVVPRGGDAIIDAGRSVYFTTETSIMKLVK